MVSAFILIGAGSGSSADVRAAHTAAHAIDGVKTFHLLAGPADAIVYVEVPDMNGLMQVVGKLHGIPGIAHTDTRIVMPIP